MMWFQFPNGIMIKQGDIVKIKPHGAWTRLSHSMRVVKIESGVAWLSEIHFIDGREIRQKNGFNSFVVADFKEIKK